jgi:hypothetical protein
VFGILKKSLTVNPSCKDVCQLCFWSIICWKNLPLSTNMFYNFEEKKRTLSKMIWGKKKFDFITPKRLRENICPQRLLLLSEGNPLCLYYRLVKENRSSWLRTNNRPRRNFLLFLKGNIITLKTFSLWRALFCYVSSKLFSPYW